MDQPNRIKDILRKIEAEESAQPLMPKIDKAISQPSMDNVRSMPKAMPAQGKFSKWRVALLALVAFLALIAIGYAGFAVYKNYELKKSDDPRVVIEAVGKLTALPLDEAPTVSTVTEVESIKDQPFFKDAEIGDKVIVYNLSKKAYLYRPSEGKIINIAPLSE